MGFSDNLPYEKVGKNEPVCIADEVPFDIPESWEWVRLGSVIELQSGQDMTPDKYNSNGQGIPYITGASNIENGKLLINRWTDYGRAFAYSGDILLTCKGTVGAMIILQESKVHIARQIMAVRPIGEVYVPYIKLVLETLVENLRAAAKSMIPGIAREDVFQSLFPIPPFDEQHRIVHRFLDIEPLLELYTVADTKLISLNAAFPETLKKSILQEAVQGKLVPQDPNDEPASVLLERIRAEKEQLIKEGKIKRDKHESVIFRRDNSYYEKMNGIERCIDNELPFEIPESWEWCRLGTILQKLTDGTHSTPKYAASGIPFISVKDISSGKISFESTKFISEEEHELLASRCDPHRDDILLTKVETTGIPVLVDTDRPFSIFVSVAQLRFSTELLDKFFLIYLLKSPLVQTQCRENTKGVGNKNWVMRDIANTLICIPPLAEQKRIQASLANVLKSI
ncbi:restriction endonuclease subunit S [Faecalibacterium duncaniae]